MDYENITASYDVGIAKKYGLASAILLNKLNYLSKYSPREDGYCWRTAKELEDELGLSRKQQELAIKKLVDANIIEVKNTYIEGTHIKCKHFKLITDCYQRDIPDCYQRDKSEGDERDKSINNNKHNNRHNNKEINKEILEDRFEEIWKLYPRKQGKTDAFKKYVKVHKEVSDDEIIKGIMKYVEDINKNKTPINYVKMGSSWFNEERWKDKYEDKEKESWQ